MGNLIKKRYFLLLMHLKLMIQQNTNSDVMTSKEKDTKEFFDSKTFLLDNSIDLLNEEYKLEQGMTQNVAWAKKIAIKTENPNKSVNNLILEFTLFVNNITKSYCIKQIKVGSSLVVDIKELLKISEGTKNSNYPARPGNLFKRAILPSEQAVGDFCMTFNIDDKGVIILPDLQIILDFCIFFINEFHFLGKQEEARDKYKDLILKLKDFIN